MSITLTHLRTLQASHLGTSITIRRGGQSCALRACAAQVDVTVQGPDGSLTEVAIDDWLIAVADWSIVGPAWPIKGDEIAVDGIGDRYLVAHPDPKRPVYRPMGYDRPPVAWRVHSVVR